jgi:hypothetical protein
MATKSKLSNTERVNIRLRIIEYIALFWIEAVSEVQSIRIEVKLADGSVISQARVRRNDTH